MHRIFNVYILKTYLETDVYGGGGGVGSFHSGSSFSHETEPSVRARAEVQCK
jgi:hypothetical protein